MDATFKNEKPPNPRSKANILEIITFSWLLELIKKGLKKDLELVDLYVVLDSDSSSLLGAKLQKLWNDELINAKQSNRKPNYFKTLFKMFRAKLLFCGIIITTLEITISISLSTLVGKIVRNFEHRSSVNQNSSEIYLAIALITILLIRAIVFISYDMISSHLAMKMRVATCNLIYKKALRLKINSLDQTSTGKIVNLLSSDVYRFDTTIGIIPFLWIGPLETIIAIYLLWLQVGVSSVFGITTILIFIPLQVWLGSKASDIRLKTANRTDKRVNLMNEIISGLQVIKMYTWELFFDNLTKDARKKEMDHIVTSVFIKAALSSFFLFHTRIALFVNLLAYILLGNYITASKVFMISSYYDILRITQTVAFTPGIGLIAELLVSIKRIEDFLLHEEKIDQSLNITKTSTKNDASKKNNNSSIVVLNASTKWTDSQSDYSLKNINLTVKPGQLVAIIGPAGAGKSTLLLAILRELPVLVGNLNVNGIVSYASQNPWLFPGSVRQNILFGLTMDKIRYKKVIKACSLKTDLEQFPYGDRTIVGERGVSLSGGQRARITLARAVYKQADIYLLDDPLSAVDTHVGKHLFEKCINGYLKYKTCILVTHQIQYLSYVDHIVLMENASIVTDGTYQELQTSGLDFTRLLGSSTENAALYNNDCKLKTAITLSFKQHFALNTRRESLLSALSAMSSVEETKMNGAYTEPVIEDEIRSIGNVGIKIYLSYILSGGHYSKILTLLLVCVLTQVFASGGDYWLTFWINLEERVFTSTEPLMPTRPNSTFAINESSDEMIPWIVSRKTCIVMFGILTFSVVIGAIAELILLVSVCTTASANLHNRMFSSIIRATMEFINKNPSGRILNRFSKDVGLIDETLPTVLFEVIQIGLLVIGILIVVGIVNPYFIPPTIIVALIFIKMRSIYLKTARNVKRLEGVARSPLFTHVNASIQGLTTIRAFEEEETLSKEFSSHQDLHSSAWYLFIALNRAFGFWLDVVCIFYISVVTFYFILLGKGTYGGNVGLAITQVIGLTSTFQWVMRQTAELENQIVSVERVLEYTNIPQEPALESTPDKKPPIEWPNKGQIIFQHFYLRYELDSPFILKNLNINIKPTEKVGIVGRTGAGKSSLIGAIFRLAFSEGNIFIDDVEIHNLGLHDLRSKISIIPQEPVLFSGTIRKNLDPFDEYPDHILWTALNEVELKDHVENLTNGLNSTVCEGGSNFSVGQRQLVCLARAIVRNNKILVLDEATANIDPQTDTLIQNTIRNKFQTCTVLTIAHRLNTVMDSHKILVMDAGTVVEFDRPYELLKKKTGYFYKMVEQTGPANASILHSLATEVHNNMCLRKTTEFQDTNDVSKC